MSEKSDPSPPPGGQFLVYRTEDGKLKMVDGRLASTQDVDLRIDRGHLLR